MLSKERLRGWIDSGGVTDVEVGNQILFTAWEQGTDCYGWEYPPFQVSDNVDWDSSDENIATVDDGLVTIVGVGDFEIDGRWWRDVTTNYGGWCPDMFSETKYGDGDIPELNFVPDCNWCQTGDIRLGSDVDIIAKPKVANITATGATKITAINGNQNIIHFVTPKGGSNDQVTLTATLSQSTPQILNDISWEGATESASNPLEAAVSKSAASKTVVTIKYRNKQIKELRVWVVWSTITSTQIAITSFTASTGKPPGQAVGVKGGYNFTHTIQPGEIITDSNRPNFSGANVNPPPSGAHPISGVALSGGANKKWDGSRQIRFKILNPNNISHYDTSFSGYNSFPADSASYPTADAEGNDDIGVVDETNDPYANSGALTEFDESITAICDRAGVTGNTFESRLQFREFTRLEIEGAWFRISDFYLWKFHRRQMHNGSWWANDNSVLSLDNSGF